MALEEKFEVPLLSNSYDNLCNNEYDDDESFLVRKLVLKCQKLLYKKKFYKQNFLKLSKSFEDLKLKFLKVYSSSENLTLDLKKKSISLKENLVNVKKKNELLLKEILELKNSIFKFHKGKKTFDNLLSSQRFQTEKFGLGFFNGASTSLSHSKFVKATLSSSSTPYESFKAQDFKTESLINPSAKGKPLKANVSKAQAFKSKGNKPQPHHAFMYHNKRHTYMHFRPQNFVHCCDCEMHTHPRTFMSGKATNYNNHAKLAYVGRQKT